MFRIALLTACVVGTYLAHPTLVKRADCEDTGDAEDCAWWNEQGYCTNEDYKEAMIEQCAATCGCEEVEERSGHGLEERSGHGLEERSGHGLEERSGHAKRECENKGSPEDCEWWQGEGYCTNDEFKEAMMDQCPCSCESTLENEVEREETHGRQLAKLKLLATLKLKKKDCADTANYCAVLQKQGACNEGTFGDFGKKVRTSLCPQTCATC